MDQTKAVEKNRCCSEIFGSEFNRIWLLSEIRVQSKYWCHEFGEPGRKKRRDGEEKSGTGAG